MSRPPVLHVSAAPWVRRVVALAAALLVSCAALPAASHAGQYRVFMCQTPNTGSVGTTNLTVNGNANGLWYDNNCGAADGHVGLASGLNALPPQGRAYATLTAAANTKFVAFSLARSIWVSPQGGPDDPGASLRWTVYAGAFGDENALDVCNQFLGCTGGAGTASWANAAGVGAVLWDIVCASGPVGGCAGPGTGAPRIVGWVTGIDLTVSDTSFPTLNSAVGGSAVSGTALAGPKQVIFSASDLGGGVREATATLDGATAGTWSSGNGNCGDRGNAADVLDYTTLVPCDLSAELTVPVNTSVVADGTRNLRVLVRDAAGNESILVNQNVQIDNVPPPSNLTAPAITGVPQGGLKVGQQLGVQLGTWSGAGITRALRWQRRLAAGFAWTDIPNATGLTYTVAAADVGQELRVVERATNGEGSNETGSAATTAVQPAPTPTPTPVPPTPTPTPTPAPAQPTPTPNPSASPTPTPAASPAPSASPTPSPAQQTQSTALARPVGRIELATQDVRSLARGSTLQVRGRVVSSAGLPVGGVPLRVSIRLGVTGAPWEPLTALSTDATGAFSVPVPTGASRDVRVEYDHAEGTATAEASVPIRASLSITPGSQRVRRFGRLRLKGKLDVDGLTKRGAYIDVQLRQSGAWRTIAAERTDASGRWSWSYRLPSGRRATYVFRARLRPSGDVASAATASAPARVTVR